MLPVAGRPMLERVLAHLATFGIDDVVLSLGFLPDAFRSAYPDGMCAGVALHYAVEDHPLDTAGAIAFAAAHAGLDEPFVVVNGDVITDLDIASLVEFHQEHAAEATIALTPVEDPSAFGVVPTDERGRVSAFIEKPPRDQAPTNLINAGTYVLDPSVLELIAPNVKVSIEREIFPALVGRQTLYAMASDAAWIDAGTPESYRRINLSWASTTAGGIDPSASVAADASVTDSVIGAASFVGAGATVRGSVLLDGVTVGSGATVVDAIVGYRVNLGPSVVVRAGAVIGDDVDVAGETVISEGQLVGGSTLHAQ